MKFKMTEETEKPNESEEKTSSVRKMSSSSSEVIANNSNNNNNNNNNYINKSDGIVVSTLMYNGYHSSTQETLDDSDETITTFTFDSTSPVIFHNHPEDDDDEQQEEGNNGHEQVEIVRTKTIIITNGIEQQDSSPVSPSKVFINVSPPPAAEECISNEDTEKNGGLTVEKRNECLNEDSVSTDEAATAAAPIAGPSNANANGDSRRHSKSSSLPHGVKLCSETTQTSESSSTNSTDETDNQTEEKWAKLEEQLNKALADLKAKDDEVEKLKDIKQQVEGELEDLTASLFVEAHKMVSAAKMKEISSEKCLKEAQMQMDGLQAEVTALKALLITSTPSRPNLGGIAGNANSSNGISIFKKQHKRYPSHNQLQYGRTETETEKEKVNEINKPLDTDPSLIDPAFFKLFVDWRVKPILSNKDKNPFLQKIYNEDIEPCLVFENDLLVVRLKKAIEENSIWVEPVAEKDKTNIPKECAFLCIPRICHYRLSFDYQSDEWFEISQFCRDRIAAVCEFLNYLRYIKNGLVKSADDVAYWEIIRLRKQMALAKLGIPFQ